MPEQVHNRLDRGSVPLETRSAPPLTEKFLSNSKKRKRGHLDPTYLVENAKSQGPSHKSLPYVNPCKEDHDQYQLSNGSDGLQPAAWRTSKPKSKSKKLPEDFVRPSNDNYSLKDRAKSLEASRKSLPIWSHISEIREALVGKDVLLLLGETGSGKSTQVPQMLVTEPWCKTQSVTLSRDAALHNVTLDGGKYPTPIIVPRDRSTQTVTVGGCIAITEPRRVAAITLARRVADETGSPLGNSSPKSTVGYSVRFEQSTSPNTKIKFLTEGTLLQEMLRDPWLKAYSAVVVDEVHERGINVDLLLGFLRSIVAGKKEGRGGLPLKVRLCSGLLLTVRDFFLNSKTRYRGGNGLVLALCFYDVCTASTSYHGLE